MRQTAVLILTVALSSSALSAQEATAIFKSGIDQVAIAAVVSDSKGKLVTINELRATLAKKHSVGIACPITTGIFSWIAADAADEAAGEGAKRITPYWRTLKTGGELNPKYPGGIAALKSHGRGAYSGPAQRDLL